MPTWSRAPAEVANFHSSLAVNSCSCSRPPRRISHRSNTSDNFVRSAIYRHRAQISRELKTTPEHSRVPQPLECRTVFTPALRLEMPRRFLINQLAIKRASLAARTLDEFFRGVEKNGTRASFVEDTEAGIKRALKTKSYSVSLGNGQEPSRWKL